MKKTERFDHSAEQTIIRRIEQQWKVRVAELGDPYDCGLCFIDSDERILAWLRVVRRKNPNADLVVDVRTLTEVIPFVWASRKPLVFVVDFPGGLRYAIWKPGMADFCRYRPDPEKGQTLYDTYWDAVIPAAELKPLGLTFPEALTESPKGRKIRVQAGTGETPMKPAVPVVRAPRKATEKSSRWPNIIQVRRNW
jgi:hypothetical protein